MRRLLHVLCIAAALVVVPSPASAATFTVTRTDDPTPDGCKPGDCSLREAIVAANAAGGPDAVVVPSGTYVLSIPPDGTPEDGLDGDLDIGGDLLIQGAGARTTVIDANHVDRAIHVCCNIEVDILDVTIRNGTTSSPFGGGGLFASSSDVGLTGVAVVANATTNGNGGGLTVINSVSLLSVRDSVIAGNVASETGGANGGGLNNGNQATAVLTNVTVTGNRASQLGGGIEADGPIHLDNVTITGNTATQDAFYSGASRGGGIAQEGPSANLANSIVAGNFATDGDPDCHTIIPITSQGHNLVRGHTSPNCNWTPGGGDVLGVDPLLGPLANNGGPTDTHALLKGSPAIDAGGGSCAPTDQRGLDRKTCDIGAFELVLCGKVPVNRIGTPQKDSLNGTSGRDGMLGFGGSDRLRGKGGADALCGGPNKDLLKGGGAKDRLDGGPGPDVCVGQAGRDKAKACETKKSIP